MENIGYGWKLFIGVSDSKIQNGLWSEDYAGEKLPDLECVVYEIAPNAKGCIKKAPVCVNASTTDPIADTSGGASIPRQDTIRCQYMGGTNQIVPCIHIGEQVWVIHFEGSDMWYWLPMARHPEIGIRQHEHLRWFAMNRCKSVIAPNTFKTVTDDETYFVDINTNPGNKLVQVHTAKNDGEFCGYDIRIYPELGRLEIMDTLGNELSLDSKNTIWYMRNIDDSFLKLDKEDITLSCKRDMTINCGRNMVIHAGKDQTITVDNDRTDSVANKRTTSIGADDTYVCNADHNVTVAGNEVSNISGRKSITTGGIFYVKGGSIGMNAGGAFTLKGAIAVSGPSFNVTSASGAIPGLVIVFGSNAW